MGDGGWSPSQGLKVVSTPGNIVNGADEPHHAEEAQLRKQKAQQTEREERLAQREARLDVAERRLGAEKDRVVIGGGET